MTDQKPAASSDPINHPGHYNAGKTRDADGTAKFEAIKLIEDWGDWDLPPYLDVALQLIVDGDTLEALQYIRKEIAKYNAPVDSA